MAIRKTTAKSTKSSIKKTTTKPEMVIKPTKVLKDSMGLYVIASGIVARPSLVSAFGEGDVVKAFHFGGTMSGVATPDQSFTRNSSFEIWETPKELIPTKAKRTRKPKVEKPEVDPTQPVVKAKRGRPRKIKVEETANESSL